MDDPRRIWRQGDVLLVQVDRIPEDTEIAPDAVVAHGEMAGHRHRFEIGVTRFRDRGGSQWVEVVNEHADLLHEEHGTIRLPRGRYRVKLQREYWPDVNRRVED